MNVLKQRVVNLRKQSGLNFDQDVFVSVLLCLIAGTSEHLILICPRHHTAKVTHMATEICRLIFGFSVSRVTCHESQSVPTFVDGLSTAIDADAGTDGGPSSSSHGRMDSKDTLTPARHAATGSSSSGASMSRSAYPISPVDFTVQRKSSGRHHRVHHHRAQDERKKRHYASMPLSGGKAYRLEQALVISQFEAANELVQAALMELVVTNEIRMPNARYQAPKPFLTIVVLPENEYQHIIPSPLLDQFFISYRCTDASLAAAGAHESMDPSTSAMPRRAAHFSSHEIDALERQAKSIYVHIDVTRYIRDIIVGLRTHPRVTGGLTARTSEDLVRVTKLMAAIFQRTFLTPELVAVAVEKVVGHRLRIKTEGRKQEIDTHDVIADIIGEILQVAIAPV
ncbi:hypothetical protein BC940DRAFT_297540 [Gongronella butleri]|nr:hypothetical protein BC940DRAFT_297540 [Gongronella butleri]